MPVAIAGWPVGPCCTDRGGWLAASNDAASCTLSTTGTVRGSFTGCMRAISSPRHRVMSARSALR